MAEVFAGFVCGFGLALIVTPLVTYSIVRARPGSSLLQRTAPEGVSLVTLSVFLHMLAFLLLTALGMVLGLMLNGIEDRRPEGGLGSPNAVFTALVLGVTAIAVLPLAVAAPRWRAPLIVAGVAFAVAFGWIMPYLSLAGPGRD